MPSSYSSVPAALLVLFLGAAHGQNLPLARLASVFPPGGQRGTSFEVTVAGANLDETRQLAFAGAGVSATPTEAGKFLVTIASNAVPAVSEVRVVGRFGISNSRLFSVSDSPEVVESGDHSRAETATPLPLDTIVNGRVDANALDYYQITAQKGQRLLISCEAAGIDSRLRPSLLVIDASGAELARMRQGALLDFVAPADGAYRVAVHDFVFGGGPDYFYRLSARTGPRIDYVFPPAAPAGSKGKFTLIGRNLPGSTPAPELTLHGKPLERLTVEIEMPPRPAEPSARSLAVSPAAAVIDAMEYRLETAKGISNPVLIGFATAPVVTEQNPNDRPDLAQQIVLPCEVAGQFYPPGDQDWLTFQAKKGEVFWVEMYSHRLGLPTDPFILIQHVRKNDKGEETVTDIKDLYDTDSNIGGLDFDTSSRDPAWRFEVKDDGTYRLLLRDLFNVAESLPGNIYRLSLRREEPDFRLVAMPVAPKIKDKQHALPWSLYAHPGETLPVEVLAFRRDNFGGEIKIVVESLPAGASCLGAQIPAGGTKTTLLITATEAATNWSGTLKVRGEASVNGSNVTRYAQGGAVIWTIDDANNEPVISRTSGGVGLALTGEDPAPLTIAPAEDKAYETSVAGKLKVPLRVARHGEFTEKFKVKATGPPGFDKAKELEIDPKETNAVYEVDLTQTKLPPGEYVFYLTSQTKGKYRPGETVIKQADIEVKQAEQRLEESKEKSKAAEQARDAAAKQAVTVTAQAKQLEDKLTEAQKELAAVESAVVDAAVKFAQAKSEAEKSTADAELAKSRDAAEKTLVEHAGKIKSLQEKRAAAQKVQGETSAQIPTAVAAKESAEKLATEATTKSKAAETAKSAAEGRAKELKDKFKSREVALNLYSSPVKLVVTPAPINLSAMLTNASVVAGQKVEWPATIKRLYDFNDPVEVSLVVPKDTKDLKVTDAAIGKDQSTAALHVEVAADAMPGERKLSLVAKLKLNNQDIKVEQPFTLTISPIPPPAAEAVKTELPSTVEAKPN